MPVSTRFSSKRTMPGRREGFSKTTIGWPMAVAAYRPQYVASMASDVRHRPVPIRTMLAVVGSVMLTIVVIEVLLRLRQIVIWTAVSALFAIVLHPPVDMLVKRLKMARALAALLVFLAGTAVVFGCVYAFVRPLADQVTTAVNEVPSYVSEAQAGQ